MYVIVPEENDQRDKTDRIEEAVSEQRPPGEREHCFGEERAHPYDEQDVEHGRSDDGADADVVEGDEHADDAGEEFRGWASGGHEGRPGHIVLDVELLDDDVQARDEELVADDGQRDEHVDDPQNVQDDGTIAALVLREEVLGEERIRLVEGVVVWDDGVIAEGDIVVDEERGGEFLVVLGGDLARQQGQQHAEKRGAEGHSGNWSIMFTARPGADWTIAR